MIEPVADLEGDGPLTSVSTFNGVALSARILPAGGARGGGDWCESIVISDDVVALSIGDVCGHGVEKFPVMRAVRQTIRDAARAGLDPAQTLAYANAFLHGYDPDETATAIFGLLDTRRRTLTFANAGHPAPLMSGPFGTLFLEYPQSDFPLGVDPGVTHAVHAIHVPAATLVVFYTDGVSEHDRKPLAGAEELYRAAIHAYQTPGLLTAAVIERQMFQTGVSRDDAAILTAWTPLTPIVRDPYARSRRAADAWAERPAG